MQTNQTNDRPAIAASGLVKKFGRHAALDGVELSVGSGECLVLFGPNGAGKTTFISILSTLSLPSRGRAEICGCDVVSQPVEVRKSVGVLSHESFLYESMTAVENLQFFARMYGCDSGARHQRELLERVGITDRADSYVGTMSRGMKQRVTLARTLLHDPQVILLDEPYSGLDPHGIRILSDAIRELKSQGKTILMATHELSTGVEMADNIAIIVHGRIRHLCSGGDARRCDFGEMYTRVVTEAV